MASPGPRITRQTSNDVVRGADAGRRRARRAAVRHGYLLVGGTLVALTMFSAVLAPLLSPEDPSAQDLAERLAPPHTAAHVLGTDAVGRDILSRVVFGSRVSLTVGFLAVGVAGTIGTFLGMLAGYHGGWAETLIMRTADLQLAIPSLVLAIAVIAVLGPGLVKVIAVLGITGWVQYGRIVRGEILSIRNREYVEAARAVGADSTRIVGRHILPNITAAIVVVATLQVGTMIVTEASLSFVGLGVPLNVPSWGGMAAEGRDYLATAWWIATFPGLAIMVTVLGMNLLGDWLRDALDPRL